MLATEAFLVSCDSLVTATIKGMEDAAFVTWLNEEMDARGWKGAELARRAGLDPSSVTNVLNTMRRPGIEFCTGIGRAFGLPPEQVLRRAGLLPAVPDDYEEREIVNQVLGRLSWSARQVVVSMIRGLARTQGITAEGGVPYATDPTTDELVRLFGELPTEWRDAALEHIRQLSRIARGPQPPRIIGQEDSDHDPAPP